VPAVEGVAGIWRNAMVHENGALHIAVDPPLRHPTVEHEIVAHAGRFSHYPFQQGPHTEVFYLLRTNM
jgi:hypothetical protein